MLNLATQNKKLHTKDRMKVLLLIFLLLLTGLAMTTTQSNSVMITDIAETHGGSGFYIMSENHNSYIITNEHVCGDEMIKKIAPQIGEDFTARVLFKDKTLDLCAIESVLPHKGFKIGKSLYCGEYVIFMGYPELQPLKVEAVEHCDRVLTTTIKHGESGSPVLNLDLEVVGVVKAMFNNSELGLMVPVKDIKEFLKGK